MGQNKTGKYLKYAIGEILLVVIGILIALSINNWNEERKSKLQEIKILKQLNSDLEDNLIEIKNIYKYVNLRNIYSDSIIVYLNEKREVNDSLLKYFKRIRSGSIFNSANTTYKYIENIGINVLSNDTLRSLITEIYEHDFRNIDRRDNLEDNLIENVLKPLMRKNFEPTKITILNKSRLAPIANPIDIVSLSYNLEFINILLEHKDIVRIRLIHLNTTIESLNNLIDYIRQEIRQLEN